MPLVLPTEKTKPVQDLHKILALLYGISKIGKSTLCSRIQNAVFLSTEPGLNNLEVFKLDIGSWEELLEACALLKKGEHAFTTVVVDTADNALLMCRDYIIRKNGIRDLGDDNNKGHALVNNEFQRVMTKLAQLPYGLFIVSHAAEREIKTRTAKYTKIGPTLSAKASQIAMGLVDLILYCDVEVQTDSDGNVTERRVIRTKPTSEYEAGDRTGKLPATLPLSYAALLEAWNKVKGVVPVPANGNGTAAQPVEQPATPTDATPATPELTAAVPTAAERS